MKFIITSILKLLYFQAFTAQTVASNTPTIQNKTDEEYLLELPNCKIPASPLFPPQILSAWNQNFKTHCPKLDPIGIVSTDKILSLDPVEYSKYETCCYREIQRPEILDSDGYVLTPCKNLKLHQNLNISSMEFLLLNCTKKPANITSKSETVLDFHYTIPKVKPEIEKKLKYWKSYEGSRPLNIMFVIIDSVARTHALRSLPKTVNLLTEKLNFVDFKGYHCVGEPSSTNYVPMTLGIMFKDLDAIRSAAGYYDGEPFVYKNFSASNYLTLQMEDMAAYNVFNFNGRKGFRVKPYDYYLRPYMMIHERFGPRFGFHALSCVNSRNIFDFLLDYTLEFIDTFPDIPKYTTTYLTWPNHDSLSGTRVMDDSFHAFFQKLKEKKVLDNTVVVVLADHGYRFSHEFAESKYGLLERNLPLFMMRLPDEFIQRHPESIVHLRQNSERITSHLDLFKTIVHLHKIMVNRKAGNGSYGYNMKYGRSLLEEIPKIRTCADAQIPPVFCSCNFPLHGDKFEYKEFKKPLVG